MIIEEHKNKIGIKDDLDSKWIFKKELTKYRVSHKKLHSFSKKITLILEKNYTHSRKKLHSFSKKITLKFE